MLVIFLWLLLLSVIFLRARYFSLVASTQCTSSRDLNCNTGDFFFVQSNQPHTFVVVTLDPPIRKGQTLYPHIVLQVLFIPLF